MKATNKTLHALQRLQKAPVLSFVILFIGILTFGGASYYHFVYRRRVDLPQEKEQTSLVSAVEGVQVEKTQPIEEPFVTLTPSVTSKTAKHGPTQTPKLTPTSTISEQTADQPQNSTNYNTQPTNESLISDPEEDPYIKYLHEQQEAAIEKQEYCKQLYAEVTISLQPLIDQREALSKIYSEAIASGNADKIAKAQEEYHAVWNQVFVGYQQNYYSVCP